MQATPERFRWICENYSDWLIETWDNEAFLFNPASGNTHLLNQEDPSTLERVVTYYSYLNQARSEQIRLVRSQLAQLTTVRKNISQEDETLRSLQAEAMERKIGARGLRTHPRLVGTTRDHRLDTCRQRRSAGFAVEPRGSIARTLVVRVRTDSRELRAGVEAPRRAQSGFALQASLPPARATPR